MNLKIIELYVEIGSGMIMFTDDDYIEFDEVTKFNIDELDAIVTEAKAFREYRNSRMPKSLKIEEGLREDIPGEAEEYEKEDAASHCGKSLVYTKEMLIDSLYKEDSDQTLITKVDLIDNNINEVIQKNHDIILSTVKKEHELHEARHVLKEVPAFTDNTADCTHHTCNNSQYCITSDGRIKIYPPEPYNVYIYTTVAEVQRLRSMTARELKAFYPAYEKQTYANKRYALRLFLLDIKDEVFPPATQPVADVEPAVTPETADEPNGFSVCAEDMLPGTTPTSEPADVPIDPYVLKSRMSKRTVGLWEKFADPSKVKT